jgi:hypothetical protein
MLLAFQEAAEAAEGHPGLKQANADTLNRGNPMAALTNPRHEIFAQARHWNRV